jgi:lipopolysaccharide export system protein LptA
MPFPDFRAAPPCRHTLAAVAAFAWTLVSAPPVMALQDDHSKPFLIEADSVEINEKESRSLYSGRVEIQQGSMQLSAEQVSVQHSADRKAKHILASGNPARFSQQLDNDEGTVKARARTIEYSADSELLLLTGDAQLSRGQDSFASDRITYDRRDGVVKGGGKAKGKQRVRISIDPQQQKQD